MEDKEPYSEWRKELSTLSYDKLKWQEDANCFIRKQSGRMHPVSVKEQERISQKICTGCPVLTECLYYALVAREEYGVWGGTTEPQRVEILRSDIVTDVGNYRMSWTDEAGTLLWKIARSHADSHGVQKVMAST